MFGSSKVVWRAAAPSLLVRENEAARAVSSARVAGFDLNDTLVSSKIGAPGYQVTISDWKYYNEKVAPKLRSLHAEGFKLVIFTNQGNIRSAVTGKRAAAFKEYVDALLKDLGVPVLVLAATQKDSFRKPSIGMWEHLISKCNAGLPVDKAASFYVGDAAGGEGEHSADDSDFAAAVGLRFTHTRDFFPQDDCGGGHSRVAKRGGDTVSSPAAKHPKTESVIIVSDTGISASVCCGDNLYLWRPPPAKPIVLVVVGIPGSGKSTFADRLGPPELVGKAAASRGPEIRQESSWRRVCQDLLGNKETCKRVADACLSRGQSVVIDRTNVDVEQRALWLGLAKAHGIPCHCIAFDVPVDECLRRVSKRTGHEGKLGGGGGAARSIVMKLAKQVQPVSMAEGFDRSRVVCTAEECETQLRRYGVSAQG